MLVDYYLSTRPLRHIAGLFAALLSDAQQVLLRALFFEPLLLTAAAASSARQLERKWFFFLREHAEGLGPVAPGFAGRNVGPPPCGWPRSSTWQAATCPQVEKAQGSGTGAAVETALAAPGRRPPVEPGSDPRG